jgi:hypothetical protein
LRSHRRISRDLHHGPERLPRRSNLNLLLLFQLARCVC